MSEPIKEPKKPTHFELTGCFIEPHRCPDCQQECVGNHDGTHDCKPCGITF